MNQQILVFIFLHSTFIYWPSCNNLVACGRCIFLFFYSSRQWRIAHTTIFFYQFEVFIPVLSFQLRSENRCIWGFWAKERFFVFELSNVYPQFVSQRHILLLEAYSWEVFFFFYPCEASFRQFMAMLWKTCWLTCAKGISDFVNWRSADSTFSSFVGQLLSRKTWLYSIVQLICHHQLDLILKAWIEYI